MRKLILWVLLAIAAPTWAAEFGYHPGSAPATPVLMDGGLGFVNTGDATSALIHTAGSGETLDSLYVYAASDNLETDDINVKVYTLTAGQPDDRVLVATANNITTTPGWKGIDVNMAMTNGVTYCLAGDTANTVSVVIYRDAGGTNDAESKTTPLPDPYGAAGTNQDFKYGIYAVYTTSGGGGSTSLVLGKVSIGGNTVIGGK